MRNHASGRGGLAAVATLLLTWVVAASPAAAAFTTFETGPVRPLAMSPDGTRLFAVNTPDGRLEIFDLTGASPTKIGSVPVGLEPCAVAARNNSEVWVVNHLSDSVSVVDVASSPPRVTRTLLVGDEPRDIVFAGPGRTRVFVTTAHRGQNHPNPAQMISDLTTPGIGRADVWVFSTTSIADSPLTILTLFGDTPRALAVSPDGGTVYAAVFHSGNRTTTISEGAVCDTDSTHLNNNTVQPGCTINGVSMPGGLPLPHRNVGGNVRPEVGLIVKNTSGNQWLDELGRDWSPAVKFSLPDRDVFSIDANANPPVQNSFAYSGVGTVLFNMVVNPVNHKVYVSNGEAKNETRFEGPGILSTTVQGHLSEYRISVLDSGTVQTRHLNKHINYSQRPAPAGIKERSLATPLEMAVSSDGATLYVAAFGSSKVGVFSTAQLEADTFTPDAASHISVNGGGPAGLVLDEARQRLYVLTRFDNGLSTINTATNLETAHVKLYNPEPASVVQGRPILYDAVFTSSNGEASCSSCHIFGDFDSIAWDLGNPDDVQIPNPLPKKLQQVAQIGGTDVDFDNFHPMKGPMATQTLRGMAHHGAMHWRGDRADQNGDIFNEDIAFRNFRVAFPGLVGRDSQIPEADMQKFSDFILQVELPPNPIRNLDNSLNGDQQAGRNFMTGSRRADGIAVGGGFGFNCVGCHTLDPGQRFFGTDGQASFENETQIMKIAHLRNMYQKVGMFGMTGVDFFNNGDNGFKGDQIRGFGFLHDGSVDTMFRFLHATVFDDGGTFNPVGFTSDTQRRQVEQFLLAFDTDLAPIVGQQVTLTSSNSGAVGARISLLIARAAAGECDLIVKGNVAGTPRGWYRDGSGNFVSDKTSEGAISDGTLRAKAAIAGQELTYTAMPLGSAVRAGVDRDEDGFRDADELAAGSDPSDPNSTPLTITPTPASTATVTVTPSLTATATHTGTVTSTPTDTIVLPDTATPTTTSTWTPVPTASNTRTATATGTQTSTRTVTSTRTDTPTVTVTRTASQTPTITATRTVTPTSIAPTDTATPTPTPSATPTPTPLCGATPRSGCHLAGTSRLSIKSGTAPRLTWRWAKGDAPMPEIGSPTSTTHVALCIYDEIGNAPVLGMDVEVAPFFGWRALGGSSPRGFLFSDPVGNQGGTQKLLIKGGHAGKDSILVKSKGPSLVLPAPVLQTQLFRQQDNVTVQLVSEAGGCWQSVFSPSAVQKNLVDQYKAKN
ncbi:MAG: hypothetical protein SF182_05590 [Deltaproteobacteria bacterium]|nr:hypothetical protein [Deltaproteobacteria bacterium]